MPLSVSRAALLRRGSDAEFRRLINGLMTISVRMELIRNSLADRLGVSGPQYSLLMAIGQMQGGDGISVGQVAKALHVTSAFVASESNRLAASGWVEKSVDPDDRRSMLLRLSARSLNDVRDLGPSIRAVNDKVFASLSGAEFDQLSKQIDDIMHAAGLALHWLSAPETERFEDSKARD